MTSDIEYNPHKLLNFYSAVLVEIKYQLATFQKKKKKKMA